MTLLVRLALLALAFAQSSSLAPLRAEPLRPKPPASVPLQLDPDATTCTPSVISQAFAQHLRPWADQPPEVLNQLRQLQAQMTRASIARCLSLGRLTPEQAQDLRSELGIEDSQPQPSSRP
ncbi:MAG: hypothetical protein VKI42_09055 [Synechococcaceae cyanobacterium]|nr:hypothetical protein [Synechococcaceae cyanobacterium]